MSDFLQSSVDKLQNKIYLPLEQNPATDLHHVELQLTALEKEIDDLVYRLYGLTVDEIKIVEQSSGR